MVRWGDATSAGTLPTDEKRQQLEHRPDGMKRHLPDRFEGDPTLAPQARQVPEQSDIRQADPHRYRSLNALINVDAGEPTRYVNYYGPPGTVPTIHYDQALKIGLPDAPNVDVKGKVVFVGLSEVLLAERKDSFYTVFSKANGVFI